MLATCYLFIIQLIFLLNFYNNYCLYYCWNLKWSILATSALTKCRYSSLKNLNWFVNGILKDQETLHWIVIRDRVLTFLMMPNPTSVFSVFSLISDWISAIKSSPPGDAFFTAAAATAAGFLWWPLVQSGGHLPSHSPASAPTPPDRGSDCQKHTDKRRTVCRKQTSLPFFHLSAEDCDSMRTDTCHGSRGLGVHVLTASFCQKLCSRKSTVFLHHHMLFGRISRKTLLTHPKTNSSIFSYQTQLELQMGLASMVRWNKLKI